MPPYLDAILENHFWEIVVAILIILFLLTIFFLIRYYLVNFYAWITNFPRPKFRVVVAKDVMVSMPDGTKLATDIYKPKSPEKFPVILVRTPYNKRGTLQPYRQLASLFASQGYVVVIQDVRGKYKSEGEFFPYAYEALDGHTTVMWAGEASWSNGKVALLGLSYPGSCAWLAARYKSPYIRTIISMFTTQNTYSLWIDDCIPFLKGPLSWLGRYSGKKENKAITHKSLEPVLWHLPVSGLDLLAVKHKILFYREYLAHIQPDSFWEEISAHQCAGNLDISAYIIGGWYDPFLKGTIEDYQRMKEAPLSSKNHQSRLVIGPWAHNPAQKFKGMDLGKNANFNSLLVSTLDWCDIWLKDKKHNLAGLSKIRYFIMGKNKWRDSESWPPPEVNFEKLFLSMENNSLDYSDGKLLDSCPSKVQANHFVYNPRDPLLFRGGFILRNEGWIAPVEQEEIIAKREVLVYTTPPLDKELTIAGTGKLILHVASQAVDTDFYVELCDKHPNGKTYNLTSGIIRMRFKEPGKSQLIEPGKVNRIELSLRSVANTFLKNHCIQLHISSSDFPVHDRNLNTGMSCENSIEIKEVEQTVYSGGEYDSHLLLPILSLEESINEGHKQET